MNHIISNVLRTTRRLPIRDPFNSWGPGPWIANLTKENKPSTTTLWTMRRSMFRTRPSCCAPPIHNEIPAKHGLTWHNLRRKCPKMARTQHPNMIAPQLCNQGYAQQLLHQVARTEAVLYLSFPTQRPGPAEGPIRSSCSYPTWNTNGNVTHKSWSEHLTKHSLIWGSSQQ